jgi:phage-related protein
MILGSYTFPDNFYVTEIRDNTRTQNDEIPRRHGLLVADQYAAEKIIRVEGTLSHSMDVRAQLSSLLVALFGGRQKFYLQPSTATPTEDRYIYATAQNPSQAYDAGLFRHHGRFSIDLLCDDPFWEAETESSDTWDTTALATPAPSGTRNLAVGGDAPSWPTLALTVAGTGTIGVTVSLGDISFELAGSVTDGDVIVVDCRNGTVTLDSDDSDKMSLFDGDFFSLTQNASNVLTLEDSGAGSYISQIVTTWRNRWF